MGFDDRLWIYLVEEHDAHLTAGPAPTGRRRPAAGYGAAGGAVVVAAAVVGVVLLAAHSGRSAWAKQVIRRAAAVVTPPASSKTILHFAGTETLSPLARRNSATTVSTVSEDAWFQQDAPYRQRVLKHVPGGPMFESNSAGEVYNLTTNTVYPARRIPSGTPHYTLTPTGHAGSYRLRVRLPHGGVNTQTIDASTAKGLREGTQTVQWALTWNGRVQRLVPMVVSDEQPRRLSAQQPDPTSASFAAQLHTLLDSGHARVTRTTTADGQPAIEISSMHPESGPRTDYYVNPTTYAPIELDEFGYDSPKDVTRLHVTAYQTLPLAGHQKLLRVAIPANAHVDRTPAGYWHAAGLPVLF